MNNEIMFRDMSEAERWERLVELGNDLQYVCARYNAGLYADKDQILVRFQEKSGAPVAGVIIGITPGRFLYAHPPIHVSRSEGGSGTDIKAPPDTPSSPSGE